MPLWVYSVFGLGVLLSIFGEHRVPSVSPQSVTPAVVMPAEARPIEPVPATLPIPDVADTLPPPSTDPGEPEPLESEALPVAFSDTVVAATIGIISTTLPFDVGSTRDEVIAAQGAPPTYMSKRALWWGSSKVNFGRDGRVQSWVNGTPALNVP
jgi:hypothetical protein